MATTGKFELKTDSMGEFVADKLDLKDLGDSYQITASKTVGGAGRSFTQFEVKFPKPDGSQNYDASQLPLVLFTNMSADYTFYYTALTGNLSAKSTAGSVEVAGEFDMVVKARKDSDSAGPPTLKVSGSFTLKN